MYNDTVTLFNRQKNRSGDIWYPTILSGVNLNMDKASIIAKYGAQSTDNASLHVKYRILDGKKWVGDKIWLPPKEWSAQDSALLPSTLTFNDGQNPDFFYMGNWENEDPVSDSEYEGGFFADMNAKHDYVFAITSIGGPYSVIPHFEIMGK